LRCSDRARNLNSTDALTKGAGNERLEAGLHVGLLGGYSAGTLRAHSPDSNRHCRRLKLSSLTG
jgi:hypothetical protein